MHLHQKIIEEIEHLRELKTARTAPITHFVRKAAEGFGNHHTIASHLKSIGANKLGAGYRASVFDAPRKEGREDSVIKMYATDTAYDSFLSHAKGDADNPHHPRIFQRGRIPIGKTGQKHINVLRMEKLEPLAHDHPIRAHLQNGIIGNASQVLDRFDSGYYDSLKDAYPEFHKSIHKLARQVANDGYGGTSASLDLHLGNVMQRKDGTPVITDPLVSYHDDDEVKGVSAAKSPFGTNTLKKVLGAKVKAAPVNEPARMNLKTPPINTALARKWAKGNDLMAKQARDFLAKKAPPKARTSVEALYAELKKTPPTAPQKTPPPKTTDIMKAKNIGAIGTATANRIIARKKLAEEAPVNNAGSGNVAGLGVGPKGESGRKPMMPMVRRSEDFAGKAVFSVPPNLYDEARLEKRKYQRWTKYLEENSYDELAPIREFANANPTKPIIIENEKTGAMCYVKYGKK